MDVLVSDRAQVEVSKKVHDISCAARATLPWLCSPLRVISLLTTRAKVGCLAAAPLEDHIIHSAHAGMETLRSAKPLGGGAVRSPSIPHFPSMYFGGNKVGKAKAQAC